MKQINENIPYSYLVELLKLDELQEPTIQV